MNNKWHEIWEKRNADKDILECGDTRRIFLELKRISGWDSTGSALTFETFYEQYTRTKNELEFCSKSKTRPIKSLFEIGCGTGANLYLFQDDGIITGGIDYSQSAIETARSVLKNPKELIYGEAVDVPTDIKYDAVLSNSVFSYFDSYEYAEKVLEAMYNKSNYSIGLIDVHNADMQDAFIQFRRREVDDYDERYKDLPKFFYDKSFFLEFAGKHNMDIRFSQSNLEHYWNNDFVFNCFMTKNDN